MRKISLFTILFLAVQLLNAQNHLRADRSFLDPLYAPFYHGVASGDPLTDKVILWTRVTTTNPTVSVDWKIASDTAFTNVVNSGTVSTDTSKDYTVKVDATGLQPNKWYYYYFTALGKKSPIGRTRTTAVGNVDSLRFAIVSCSNLQAGYFNAYKDISLRNDIDAVVHLGDYIYEYEKGGYGTFDSTQRAHEPANEILTLSDYRIRHSQYKLDPDLRSLHQQYPFITIWDDHETANDSWTGGAQNHTPGTEGAWADRKSAGETAYFEWIPIRENNAGDTIHRLIKWGDLADFIMLDTRLEGRMKQVTATDTTLNDTTRTLMGATQLAWFKDKLSNSTAQWKVIGNQVMISPLINGGNPLNLDQWDGYPAERKKVYNHISKNNIKDIVFLTGDIHTSWGNDLPPKDSTYNKTTGAGSIAVEFVCTSITSPGLPGIGNTLIGLVQSQNPYMKYVDLEKHGYLLLDINKQRTQGDWVYMSTLTDKNFTTNIGGSWYTDHNQTFLKQASSAAAPRPNAAPFAPQFQGNPNGIAEASKETMVVVSCFPNPTAGELKIQYYLFAPQKVTVGIYDMAGKLVMSQPETQSSAGLFETEMNIQNLATGNYLITINAGGKNYSQKMVKGK